MRWRALLGHRPGGFAHARISLIVGFFALGGLLLVARLFIFQVRDSAHYRQLAAQERDVTIPIPARRGALLDRGGHPLAESVLYDSVYAVGSLVGNPDRLAQSLSPILQMPAGDIRAKLNPSDDRPVVLKSRVTSSVSDVLETMDLPGVYLQQEPIREYPEGSLASQVLGFVGDAGKGLAGLELSFNSQLAGKPGEIVSEKDTSGQEITLGRRLMRPPVQGSSLVLTIDRHTQEVAERLLNTAVTETQSTGGVVMVEDPHTGDLLAVANNPTYSLTSSPIYDPKKASLYNTSIVSDEYEPGSTMKPLSMAAAINQGTVTADTVMDDTGTANIDGTLIHNWNLAGNGKITMTQILVYSDNVGMQWVAKKMGATPFYHYVTDVWGFGKPTGVPLPGEVSGFVRAVGMPGWSPVDLATNSYGQGIAVTPLQIFRAFSSLANGGIMMQPRIVSEIEGPNGPVALPPKEVRRTVSAQTASTLVTMLTAVAEQPAYVKERIPGYVIAMKTGTADTPDPTGYNTSSTIGTVEAIAPAANPRFTIYFRLDHPKGIYGSVAVPYVRLLVEDLMSYYGVPPDNFAAPAPASRG